MLQIRRAEERGKTDWGWLDSRHTFSFGDYYDPDHLGFQSLRVINDDRVKAGAGFGTHGHRDMEVLSYVLEGALEHKDSLGTGSVIRPGEIQVMRAGTGVTHSEFNHSRTDPVHFLQIWIIPDIPGLEPTYYQQPVDQAAARKGFAPLATSDGRGGSFRIHQNANVLLALMDAGDRRTLSLRPGRHAWVHVARGSVTVNGTELAEGDGLAATGEKSLDVVGKTDAEVLLFDLA